jgi:hypothetical protein
VADALPKLDAQRRAIPVAVAVHVHDDPSAHASSLEQLHAPDTARYGSPE